MRGRGGLLKLPLCRLRRREWISEWVSVMKLNGCNQLFGGDWLVALTKRETYILSKMLEQCQTVVWNMKSINMREQKNSRCYISDSGMQQEFVHLWY